MYVCLVASILATLRSLLEVSFYPCSTSNLMSAYSCIYTLYTPFFSRNHISKHWQAHADYNTTL